MNWDDVRNMLLAAKDDYSQLFEKDRPIANDVNLLMQKLGRNVPSNADFRNPQAMSQWSQAAALNAPMMGVVGKLPPTKFSQAQELAQKNAALPIEQGGLGLPANNTAMDRARAMGFDTDAYHGSMGEIGAFDADFLGKRTGANSAKKGFFSTNDPQVANTYAKRQFNIPEKIKKDISDKTRALAFLEKHHVNLGNIKEKLNIDDVKKEAGKLKREIDNLKYTDGAVYPLKINLGKSMIKDYSEKSFRDESFDTLLSNASKNGFDSVTFKNVNDVLSILKSDAKKSNIYAQFDPKNIRSRFAAFDPMQKDSANLLASILFGTSLAGSQWGDK